MKTKIHTIVRKFLLSVHSINQNCKNNYNSNYKNNYNIKYKVKV